MKFNLASCVFICIGLTFLGCGSGKKAKKVEMEFVFFSHISEKMTDKYPKCISEVGSQFKEVADKKDKVNFFFSPINLSRKDSKKSSEIDYLTNKSGDLENINFIDRQYGKYFKDSTVNGLLVSMDESKNVERLFTDYVQSNKDNKNLFIYSNDDDFKLEGGKVYYGITELRNDISKLLVADNSITKIMVLIVPNIKSSETSTNNNDCPSRPDAEDLRSDLKIIVDNSLSISKREEKAKKVWETYFDEDLTVNYSISCNDRNPEFYPPGKGKDYIMKRLTFLESVIDIKIKAFQKSTSSGKISNLDIIEVHNPKLIGETK
ncbi:MAG: hypothetical protein NTX03_09340 [Bacteroidetes bacterium]|nr:hypothetical protein [Bacteroidota bacterium]